jgi:hypothetical protein
MGIARQRQATNTKIGQVIINLLDDESGSERALPQIVQAQASMDSDASARIRLARKEPLSRPWIGKCVQ